MAETFLRGEERIGLAAAIAAHAALVALIVLRPPGVPAIPPPERMTVTLSDDVGLTSTSPEPQAQAASGVAPIIGEAAAPELQPVASLPPPLPAAAPSPFPSARAARRLIPRPAGGSRIGNDFLRGVPGAQADGASHNPPAAAIGPGVQSALAGAISRQLKPHWTTPQGAEAEKLVTYLSWNLNRDGTLAGSPSLVRQEGITDANRAQASRHAEQAIRAVELAAPFDLPPEYYSAWQRVGSFRFDRRLSQ